MPQGLMECLDGSSATSSNSASSRRPSPEAEMEPSERLARQPPPRIRRTKPEEHFTPQDLHPLFRYLAYYSTINGIEGGYKAGHPPDGAAAILVRFEGASWGECNTKALAVNNAAAVPAAAVACRGSLRTAAISPWGLRHDRQHWDAEFARECSEVDNMPEREPPGSKTFSPSRSSAS
ncbi:uncharacterized protein B0T15DRAFT_508126 [Chaetomium strumarium]|uniref:Uncharacterized protein n=1 Tax=Chaetomium strumarium TaxID=1170767 RepID=A0AAJ0H4S5_9PEZI|nr:hypothetical protein B0T15DRAFT_508126 [Chaetomium strumarium]